MAKQRIRRNQQTGIIGDSNTMTYLLVGGGVVLGAALLGVLLFFNLRIPEPIRGLIQFPAPVRDHTNAPVPQTELPPVGGPHNPAWQNCGVYAEPISVENAVHSLEHGAVWITYRPDLSEEDVEFLQDRVWGEGFLLLSPYENLADPVVVTAWGVQLRLEDARDNRIGEFIDTYRGRGPEPGASCSSGVGQPIDR